MTIFEGIWDVIIFCRNVKDVKLFCTQIVQLVFYMFSGKSIYFCLIDIYILHDYIYKTGL